MWDECGFEHEQLTAKRHWIHKLIIKVIRIEIFTADTLTCHTKKSTVVSNNINNGSVHFKCPTKTWQWVSLITSGPWNWNSKMEFSHHFFYYEYRCLFYYDKSKCFLWQFQRCFWEVNWLYSTKTKVTVVAAKQDPNKNQEEDKNSYLSILATCIDFEYIKKSTSLKYSY